MRLSSELRIDPLGESAFILRELGNVPAYAVAEALRGQPGIVDATSAYDTVGVYTSLGYPETALRNLLLELEIKDAGQSKRHLIPVCYELGEDLGEVAGRLKLEPDEVISLHSGAEYRCYAIGFCPGFAFLGFLPEELSGLPRRESPRVKVPPGSVGITGRQTGVYPLETPGGWNLIGRTPLRLVDVEDAYFPIRAGDSVEFRRIDQDQFEKLKGKRL